MLLGLGARTNPVPVAESRDLSAANIDVGRDNHLGRVVGLDVDVAVLARLLLVNEKLAISIRRILFSMLSIYYSQQGGPRSGLSCNKQ